MTRRNDKARIPMSGNGLAAILLCILGVSQAVSFGGFCRECPAQIAVYGGFARFVGCRRCSFGHRRAVRIAVCKQISERCFRAVNPPHQSFAKCEIFKWVSVLACPRYMYIMGGYWVNPIGKFAKLLCFFLEGVSFLGGSRGLYIMGGIFSAARLPSDSPNF